MKGRVMTRNLNETRIEMNTECEAVPARNRRFALKKRLQDFRKEERGSVIIFSLYLFVIMLVIGGIAVDVMRAEYQRTKIQYTDDRAVLAAASLKQTVPAQDVINDYFAKAGLAQFTPTAVVEESLNSRKVTAEYSADAIPHINTMFMDLFFLDGAGPSTLDTPAAAAAIDGVEKVEISLVLDVSGSMRHDSVSGGTKIGDLQDAAKEFVDTILLNQPEEDTYSISIVPYSTQVTAGENLLNQYNVSSEHDYSHCIDFEGDDFTSTAISPSTQIQRAGHFSPRTYNDWRRPPVDSTRACFTDERREILPVSGDPAALKTYIDGFYPSGWTSTEIGIKWGAALLDPSSRSVVNGLIANSTVESEYSGRPYEYTEDGVLKVIIVMTDGDNTRNFELDPSVKDGMSPVWLRTKPNGNNKYWIYNENHGGPNKYYKAFYKKDSYWGFGNSQYWVSQPASNAVQLSWAELWNHAPMPFVSYRLLNKAGLGGQYGSFNWNYQSWNSMFSTTWSNTKDDRMDDICDAVKAKKVLVYTIGFEVSDANATKLAHCATTASHFFRVEGVEISTAFSAIAAQLNSLRLTR